MTARFLYKYWRHSCDTVNSVRICSAQEIQKHLNPCWLSINVFSRTFFIASLLEAMFIKLYHYWGNDWWFCCVLVAYILPLLVKKSSFLLTSSLSFPFRNEINCHQIHRGPFQKTRKYSHLLYNWICSQKRALPLANFSTQANHS